MASSIHLGDDEIRPLPLHAGESVISRDIELAVRKQDTDEMPIETPQHKTPTQSFDTSGILQESPKVRGKLRTFTVMASLCVSNHREEFPCMLFLKDKSFGAAMQDADFWVVVVYTFYSCFE